MKMQEIFISPAYLRFLRFMHRNLQGYLYVNLTFLRETVEKVVNFT